MHSLQTHFPLLHVLKMHCRLVSLYIHRNLCLPFVFQIEIPTFLSLFYNSPCLHHICTTVPLRKATMPRSPNGMGIAHIVCPHPHQCSTATGWTVPHDNTANKIAPGTTTPVWASTSSRFNFKTRSAPIFICFTTSGHHIYLISPLRAFFGCRYWFLASSTVCNSHFFRNSKLAGIRNPWHGPCDGYGMAQGAIIVHHHTRNGTRAWK